MTEHWAALTVWRPCKRCGRKNHVDTICSWCGGHGIVGFEGPHDCYRCGGSGQEWFNRCHCGAFRGALNLLLYDERD